MPTGPQLATIPGKLIQCFYGEDDKAASCATLKNSGAEIVKTRGSRLFNGDYDALAEKILCQAQSKFRYRRANKNILKL